jgi:hypothetical protein
LEFCDFGVRHNRLLRRFAPRKFEIARSEAI